MAGLTGLELFDSAPTPPVVPAVHSHVERELSPEAKARIAEGMKVADDNADPFWKHIFDCCVLAAARKKAEITCDDVLAEIKALPGAPSTHNLAAIGPAMQRGAKMGILERTEKIVRSMVPEKHGNYHKVWKSNYFVGAS